MMHWTFELGLAALAGGLSWCLVHWARSWRILDLPNQRSSHSRPVPRGGGAAIALISIAGWSLLAWWPPDGASPAVVAAFALGASLVAAVSFVDDVRPLPNSIRLLAHAVAAAAVLAACGPWWEVSLPLVGAVPLAWLAVPVTFVWIVGLTNAYNFMDGIDGIAASQAVVAGLTWFLLATLGGPWAAGLLGLLAAASSAGFLVHNWAPARIFMGDVGSALLGYAFAFLAVLAGADDPRYCLAGVLPVWPFVFDSAFTFVRRTLRRENIFAAHRSHLYQRLVVAGWSHAATTLLYAGLASVGACLAILYVRGETTDWLVAAVPPVLACGLWLLVRWQERRRLVPQCDPAQSGTCANP